MAQPVSPINITAAAFIIQIALVLIFTLGTMFIRVEGKHYIFRDSAPRSFSPIILAFFLISIALLAFSDEFSNVWKPLFGEFEFSGIKWSVALFLIFILDILCVSIMVWMTGGGSMSGFVPIYFILPALAIFLREPFSRIIIYLLLIIGLFSWNCTFKVGVYDENVSFPKVTYWVISIASLILTTFIGYMTRPR